MLIIREFQMMSGDCEKCGAANPFRKTSPDWFDPNAEFVGKKDAEGLVSYPLAVRRISNHALKVVVCFPPIMNPGGEKNSSLPRFNLLSTAEERRLHFIGELVNEDLGESQDPLRVPLKSLGFMDIVEVCRPLGEHYYELTHLVGLLSGTNSPHPNLRRPPIPFS
jgi:hypothetical protein